MNAIWIKYNTQSDLRFTMVKRASVDLAVSADWTPAAADAAISKDGGNFADCTNTIAIIGGTPTRSVCVWKLTITATEASCAEGMIQIVDAATKAVEDNVIRFFTYGNASAKFAGDWSDLVRMGLTALPNANAAAAGGLWILGANAAANTTLTGTAASGATPGTAALTLTGGAASTTGGGVAAQALLATGGAGAASTNGAAEGVKFIGGGTNTVASNAHGLNVTGTSTGAGLGATSGGGATGNGITATAASTNGSGISATGNGTGDGVLGTGGAGAGGDGIAGVAGGGVPIRGDITGNITGNLSGSAGSVTGAVGSVTGNVGGNVAGSVGSVTGAVGSVTGNVGGNVVGSVGSVTGLTAANLDATVSSRLAAASYTAPLDAAGTRSAVGLASANLDTQIDALPTAAENATAVLTTQMTEAYAADGAAPTLTQAVMAIQQFLQEKNVTGTTLTVKKLDGTTTAMTFTLDSATAPTSVTRAT